MSEQPALDPEAVEAALRRIFSDADYDLYKELFYEGSFLGIAKNFIIYYEAEGAGK